jgi:tRNA A37 N6-isopentenylltransferase MiaA
MTKQCSGLSRVHLLAGPTGVGKTEAAMDLAATWDAPVVVADRIQCYLDLPVTSARCADVGRHHLGDRMAQDGDYAVDDAFPALLRVLGALTGRHPRVVVEGGSISLLRRFSECRGRFRLSATVLHVPDDQAYLRRLRDRAQRMLRDGMLDELAKAWQHGPQRPFVASINGPEAVVKWCQDNAFAPADLPLLSPDGPEIAELADLVAQVHADHGHEQDAVFTQLFD